MLRSRLTKFVQLGRLTVRCGDRTVDSFVSSETGPEIIINLKNRFALLRFGFNPGLQLGRLYAQGMLRIEQGSLSELMELCLGRPPSHPQERNGGLRVRRNAFFRSTKLSRFKRAKPGNPNEFPFSFYELFLDNRMQYSSAYYSTPGLTLDDAQRAKIDHLASKLLLSDGQRVLDIGSGWGDLAFSLAARHACRVTGVARSPVQLQTSRLRAAERDLEHLVDFRGCNYRDIGGRFDRIISVGMLEQIGVWHYSSFFRKIARLLSDNGVALIQSVGRMDGFGTINSRLQTYIYPSIDSPSLSEIIPHIERAGLWITDVEILHLHHADTCRAWLDRLQTSRIPMKEFCDEQTYTMWELSLTASELGFRQHRMMAFQIQLAKSIDVVPRTRAYIREYKTPVKSMDATLT